MNPFSTFIPLTKVDLEKREVWGTAAIEQPDRTKEILDYTSSKPYFERWSADMSKATDGKSLGNVRAMHGKVAAGKLISFIPDDIRKSFEVGAKVVDDQEWEKVISGVYSGFSVGGRYVRTWNDPKTPSLKRYTADPYEVSLVDLPCIPDATFQVIKEGGETELRKFATREDGGEVVMQSALIGERVRDAGEMFQFSAADLEKFRIEDPPTGSLRAGILQTLRTLIAEELEKGFKIVKEVSLETTPEKGEELLLRDGLTKAAKTKHVDDKDLLPSDFAYVGDEDNPETWHLPIHDEGHVRAAMARFNQTDMPDADKKHAAAKRIANKAEEKHGMDANNFKEEYAKKCWTDIWSRAYLNDYSTERIAKMVDVLWETLLEKGGPGSGPQGGKQDPSAASAMSAHAEVATGRSGSGNSVHHAEAATSHGMAREAHQQIANALRSSGAPHAAFPHEAKANYHASMQNYHNGQANAARFIGR